MRGVFPTASRTESRIIAGLDIFGVKRGQKQSGIGTVVDVSVQFKIIKMLVGRDGSPLPK
jgi:hypothetical protein